MKLAVSNIAWPAPRRTEAYGLLQASGFTGLEVAPALILPASADPFAPTPGEVDAALAELDRFGLRPVSMQSLLFGVTGAALFEDEAARDRLDHALRRAIGLAEILGIPNLVFGSPRQRAYPATMTPAEADAIAVDLFRRLGDVAATAGTRLAIEPNGRAYGTNFLNRIEEAEAFVRRVAHPAVVLNFDIGALHMEGDFDRVEAIAAAAADCIGHVHLSEPQLAPAPADAAQAARALKALVDAGHAGWYSIEMAATDDPLTDLAQAMARLHAALALAGLEAAA